MKTALQRFADWATNLKNNIFVWTRIRLTALYLLIIVVIIVAYSSAMYFSLVRYKTEKISDQYENISYIRVLDHAIDTIQQQIIEIDIGTFVVAAIVSYWLAGKTLRPIKRALDAQEAFSSDASHELRTPLAVMKTSIEVALRGQKDISADVQKLLGSNLEEIQKLTALTSDLLEIARGKNKLFTKVSVMSVLKEEIDMLQILATEKKITIAFSGKSDARVLADEEALRRVFRNIIANAIAYTDENDSIDALIVDKRGLVEVIIADTGHGMNEYDLSRVFKRFYKAESSHSTGSGLGLAIVKHIIDQYKGDIQIESVLGKGTKVTILLHTV